ncbi:hypothetical protein HanRHA438_Chr12g0576651 [Helianthus annuus]|nr:hypothetical protein HanHA89_Chr12g0493491 [Helianthus annuus]KAJ0507098.1 hypothetical protein HanHA89_Chr12g0495031 [Helianthus annuus]KAJ0620317.1 hypothetical protein HanHA300_Chr00c1155g0843061 [Helianthus annuus]KAJ0620385.1 hypothetical protein HanHA300_Chr00c1069g0837171 [Helianthus annuus]KAJ0620393.1 hypothetical protein HanHA300_Chr00c1058g0835831 [Helianthus annuus]
MRGPYLWFCHGCHVDKITNPRHEMCQGKPKLKNTCCCAPFAVCALFVASL